MTSYQQIADRAAATTPSDPVSEFRALVDRFCQLVKLGPEAVDAVMRGDVITIDDISVSMVLNATFPEAQAVTVFVEMGAPPVEGEAAALRMVLQRNFHMSMERGPSFCISSITGRVLQVAHFAPSGLAANTLHDTIQRMVDQAVDWRATYFLWAPKAHAGQ